MKFFIFLWNPWPQYEHTKHNIWFLIGDELVKRRNCETRSWDKNAKALITSTNYNGEKILLVKPQTYMNLSGQTISFLLNFYKRTANDIVLIHDDIDLPQGTIRYKFGWSSGGQNGVKDTIAKIGTDQFARIKIGIDRPSHPSADVADYVLSKLSKEQSESIPDYTDEVIKKIDHHFLQKDLQVFDK